MVTDNFNSKITMTDWITIAIEVSTTRAAASFYYSFADFFAEYPFAPPASFPCSRRCMTWV